MRYRDDINIELKVKYKLSIACEGSSQDNLSTRVSY